MLALNGLMYMQVIREPDLIPVAMLIESMLSVGELYADSSMLSCGKLDILSCELQITILILQVQVKSQVI